MPSSHDKVQTASFFLLIFSPSSALLSSLACLYLWASLRLASLFLVKHPLHHGPCSNITFPDVPTQSFFTALLPPHSLWHFFHSSRENSACYGAVTFQPISPHNGHLLEDKNWVSSVPSAKLCAWH